MTRIRRNLISKPSVLLDFLSKANLVSSNENWESLVRARAILVNGAPCRWCIGYQQGGYRGQTPLALAAFTPNTITITTELWYWAKFTQISKQKYFSGLRVKDNHLTIINLFDLLFSKNLWKYISPNWREKSNDVNLIFCLVSFRKISMFKFLWKAHSARALDIVEAFISYKRSQKIKT